MSYVYREVDVHCYTVEVVRYVWQLSSSEVPYPQGHASLDLCLLSSTGMGLAAAMQGLLPSAFSFFVCGFLRVCGSLMAAQEWVCTALRLRGATETNWYCRGSLLRCDNWWIDLDEHIGSRINQSIATDCRMFRPRRPLSAAYKAGLETNWARRAAEADGLHLWQGSIR